MRKICSRSRQMTCKRGIGQLRLPTNSERPSNPDCTFVPSIVPLLISIDLCSFVVHLICSLKDSLKQALADLDGCGISEFAIDSVPERMLRFLDGVLNGEQVSAVIDFISGNETGACVSFSLEPLAAMHDDALITFLLLQPDVGEAIKLRSGILRAGTDLYRPTDLEEKIASINRDADVNQALLLLLTHHPEPIIEENDEVEESDDEVAAEGVKRDEGVEEEDGRGSLLATGDVASALKRSVCV